MMPKVVQIADLFCGAGGTSTGAIQAARACGYEPRLTAVNHWPRAVETHAANHPEARHVCASLDALNPRELFAEGELDILWASPECTHHSQARGGRPINDQSRATAWCVVRWAEALRPGRVFVENVPEFIGWGGLGCDGRPLRGKKGQTFIAWIGALESLGYRVDWRVLCAADYGDPTTRRRLFIQAARGRRRIQWPEPSHAPRGGADLLGTRQPWRAAREIIDWSLPGGSIYDRARPLSGKTLARIEAGLRKFGLAPMLISMEHGGSLRSVDLPINTITTAKGGAHALCQPFLIHTAHGKERAALAVEQPLPTVTGNRGDVALCEPHLLPQGGGGAMRPVSEPAPSHSVATDGAIALVEPFLVSYYGTGQALSIEQPLDAVTTRDRFGLVRPQVEIDGKRYRLDVRFRMLQPHELAAAQGFPAEYRFAGTKTEVVKQIGNAVPCGLARAIVRAALEPNSQAET